jgi:cysteine desulfurase
VKRRIYFDSAGTTPLKPEILKTYESLLETYFANSEALYEEGSEVHRMMEKARAATAGLFGVQPDEILYTSGSCESNSTAIKGVCFASKGRHIITSCIEHSSVINACRQMERVFGYDVTWLPVSREGRVNPQDLRRALRNDTVIVSIMHVNNEVGSINPIQELAHIVKTKSRAVFHSDLTQSVGKVPVNLKEIDLASVSAHKLHGLKGSGILIKKKYVPMEPLISGGEQEFGLRGGTANACADMVFAKTARLALEQREAFTKHTAKLKARLEKGLREIDGILFNSPEDAVSCILNFSYEPIPAEVMQNALNSAGFMVSARSTCESNSNNPSHVLSAMGFSDRRASSCIRVSLSMENTEEEIDAFITALKEIIRQYGRI